MNANGPNGIYIDKPLWYILVLTSYCFCCVLCCAVECKRAGCCFMFMLMWLSLVFNGAEFNLCKQLAY